jgi:hypothetical protein
LPSVFASIFHNIIHIQRTIPCLPTVAERRSCWASKHRRADVMAGAGLSKSTGPELEGGVPTPTSLLCIMCSPCMQERPPGASPVHPPPAPGVGPRIGPPSHACVGQADPPSWSCRLCREQPVPRNPALCRDCGCGRRAAVTGTPHALSPGRKQNLGAKAAPK